MDIHTRKALFASAIASILAIPFTYGTVHTVALLTNITLPFLFCLIAYGMITSISIYTIIENPRHNNIRLSSRNDIYRPRVKCDNPLVLGVVFMLAIIAIGTLNGYLAVGIANWWQPVLPLIINTQASLSLATLSREQLNETQPQCKICLECVPETSHFYLPNSANQSGPNIATHSLLCEPCYTLYPTKERDLVHGNANGWQPYKLQEK